MVKPQVTVKRLNLPLAHGHYSVKLPTKVLFLFLFFINLFMFLSLTANHNSILF